MLCKRQKIVHLQCLQLCILLTYQIFVFAHISRIEEEYHITAKDQTKNGFICLKDFLLSNHLSMEENEKKETYVAPMSKKFTSVSMSLKLSTADWLPKNRTTSPAKVEKKRSAKRRSIETNDDKLLRRPAPSHRHHHQKRATKNFLASLSSKHKERRANHKKSSHH